MESATDVVTPGTQTEQREDEQDNGEAADRRLSDSDTTLYRGVVARMNYLAQDRPDIGFATKECSRSM